ncbi:MAG TPA: type I 3-dehydroquinate dehydratase [Syntrophales bacterium]|nr:type I 3-dehydroquinate dehydratase [Syntrophales bacterium]HPQ44048.1 type I 3-dehydroquinate dehydratase [Syntrophales bacterium]
MICIPIVAKTNEEALTRMDAAFLLSDLVELRVDRIEGANLKELLSAKKGPVLVTARRKKEGGNFRGSETQRIALLREAVRLKADFVDVELSTTAILVDTVREEIRKEGDKTKLIISHHDFNRTPPYRTLQGICDLCLARGADIVKIATFADSLEANLRILHLIGWAQRGGHPIISLCMGEKGTISRVMAPLFGSYLSFASLDEGQESAPGQLTAVEMHQILRILER